MTITPTRHDVAFDTPNPAELLIEEARRLGRRRRLAKGLVVLSALAIVAILVSTITHYSRSQPSVATGSANSHAASSVPTCSIGQLSVTSKGLIGAGGTDGGILLFRNVSSRACSLFGYPNVRAIGTGGSVIEASHMSNGMLGGWDWTGLSKAPKPPTIVLTNKSELASNWYQYSENGPAGYKIFRARTLSIGLAGSSAAVHVRGSVFAADGKMSVTPFVPGATGTAEPRTKH
jgi:uncharacterized protein DUF4232